MKSHILIVLPSENFRDTEYITPREFLKQSNYKVTTTSTQKKAIGRFGFAVNIDVLLEEINPSQYDGIFFVGGLGCLNFMENQTAKELAQKFVQQDKVVGAICAAPRLLLHWGLLANEICTGNNWDNEFPSLCRQSGAHWKNEDVFISGNFVTAHGPECVEDFALKFMERCAEKR